MIKFFYSILFLVFSLSVVAQTQPKPVFGSFTDSRDKKSYKTVTIGNQTWFGSNLAYKSSNSFCYNDSLNYCTIFGRLYTHEAALTACPAGWHLPTSDEWLSLINQLGGNMIAGSALKEIGSDNWKNPNEKANNSSGLKIFPAGFKDALSNSYFRKGEESVFWSSTKLNNSDYFSWSFFLQYSSGTAFTDNITLSNNLNGYSVRCLKNIVLTPKF